MGNLRRQGGEMNPPSLQRLLDVAETCLGLSLICFNMPVVGLTLLVFGFYIDELGGKQK